MTLPDVRPRIAPRWRVPPSLSAAPIDRLVTDLHVPRLVAQLLVTRGYSDPEAAKSYLRPRLASLHDPHLLRGMDAAVARLVQAVERAQTVLVHGDYDVDGICSTAIVVRVLRHLGGIAVPFVPHRLTDGYDLTDAGVDAAIRAGARVVVTCDCGTSAHQAIDRLRAHDIDVIVTDHHLPSMPVPECTAVLNPRQRGCEYPDKDLCAAGVAFKLSLALLKALGGSDNVAFSLLDLVALATVADVAPLRGENRAMVRYGLRLMAETRHAGLRALLESSGLSATPVTAGRVGFVLAPRLNAAGRVGHAMRGVELMLSSDMSECYSIARELEELNRARQELDRETWEQARELVLRLDLAETYGIALGSAGWHAGVIGIVASRLVEEFARPVMLVALADGVGKGSGRSIPAFDLHAGLVECREHLVRFGGHRAAAGITIDEDRLAAFAQQFNDVARSRLTPDDLTPELRIDLDVTVDDVTLDLEKLMRHFEPFGIGNPAPVLAVRRARLVGTPRTVGRDGLKVWLRGEGGRAVLEALGWGMANRASEFTEGDSVDVAFRVECDTYGGQSRVVARIADIHT